MQQIQPPVTPASSAAAVRNLQGVLLFLLDLGEFEMEPERRIEVAAGLEAERAVPEYGVHTLGLVRLFQEKSEIQVATGEVDTPTALAMNQRLIQLGGVTAHPATATTLATAGTEGPWIIRGQVVGPDGPIDRVLVSAFDRDLLFGREDENDSGQLLGNAFTRAHEETGESGWFEIGYTPAQFGGGAAAGPDGEIAPDLVFLVTRDELDGRVPFHVLRLPDGETVTEERPVSEDDLLLGIPARRVETVRLLVDGASPTASGPSQYESTWRTLATLMPRRLPADGDDAARELAVCAAAARLDEAEHRDVTFAARETGLDDGLVEHFVVACRLAAQLPEPVPVPVLYALVRAGGFVDMRSLAVAQATALTAAVEQAAALGWIPRPEPARVTTAIATVQRLAPVQVLDEAPAGRASLREVLALTVDDEDRRIGLMNFAADFTGTHTDFTDALRTHEEFGEDHARIAFVTQLASLTGDNVAMVKALSAVPGATSMRSLTLGLDAATARTLAAQPDVQVPENLPAEDEAARRELYADGILSLLRNAFPTAAVARRAAELVDEGDESVLSPRTAAFLEKAVLTRDDFDLATSPVAEFASLVTGDDAERATVLGEASLLQRLFRISTGEAAVENLLRSPYRSAYDITSKLTLRGFVLAHQEDLGGKAEAALTYRRAEMVSAANMLLALNAHQVVADATPLAVSAAVKEVPTWARMFPGSGGCSCGHCRSWLSPAAYFVDLLLFLDRRNAPDQAKTPLDVLLGRRPDLAHLKLSCENTETALPYVDLVNEVLESCVAEGGRPAPSAAHDVNDETSEELRATPRHVRKEAYDRLAKAAFPPSLPYDRTLDTTRAYLGHLGVERAELLDVFPPDAPEAPGGADASGSTATATVPSDDVIRRARHREALAERLGVSAREHEIITGHDFAGEARFVELTELYGPGDGEAAVSMDVPSFLDRTALNLAELVALLGCRFISPAQPLYDRLDALYGDFGVTSTDLRRFLAAERVADPELTATLAARDRTPEELAARLDADFPAERIAQLIVLHSDRGQDCDVDSLRLQHLDGSALTGDELRRIAVFVRLWRKLGWTTAELDTVLLAFGTGRGEVSPETLAEIGRMLRLRAGHDTDVITLLSLWRPLDAQGPAGPYPRLFRNPAVRNPLDPDFALRPGGGELSAMDQPEESRPRLQDKAPAILAALRITETELTAVTAEAVRRGALDPDPGHRWLSLANLSVLHRHVLLARLLDLRVTDLCALLRLSGADPFSTPQAALDFAELSGKCAGSGATIPQLDYLYGEPPPGPDALAPTAAELDALAASLAAAWSEITREHALPDELTADWLRGKLTLLAGADATTTALDLVEGRYGRPQAAAPGKGDTAQTAYPQGQAGPGQHPQGQSPQGQYASAKGSQYSASQQQPYPDPVHELRDAFVAAHPDEPELARAAALAVFPAPCPLGDSTADEETKASRRLAAAEGLLPLLHRILARTRVHQTLGQALGTPADVLRTFLDEPAVLESLDRPGESAIGDFLRRMVPAPQDTTQQDTAQQSKFQTQQPPEPPPGLDIPYIRLHRLALVTRTLSLTPDELRRLSAQGGGDGGFDPASLVATPNADGFAAHLRLAEYAGLRDRLTPGPTRLADVLGAPPEERLRALVAASAWDEATVTDALTACAKTVDDLSTTGPLLELEKAIGLARRTGVAPTVLKSWVGSEATARELLPEGAVDAVKAKYDHEAWLDVARSLNNPLRERQRDALVAHVSALLGTRSPGEIFEHLLIDVEMSACMLTSRLKQAISSVQLFVQRCLLNLDPDVKPGDIDAREWEWRRMYRLWEANRRIFLFPENWIEPELRDDKSPFFKELEADLLQADVSPDTVRRGLLGYLRKTESVANLEVCGFHAHTQDGKSVLHVVGRTRTGVPRSYYYRRQIDGIEWTPWEPVPVDIEGVEKEDAEGLSGVHLLPTVWRGKLFLFWPQFVKKTRKSKLIGQTVSSNQMELAEPRVYWEVKLAWSSYESGNWSPKQVTTDFVELTAPSGGQARPLRRIGERTAASPRVSTVGDVVGLPKNMRLRSRIDGDVLNVEMITRGNEAPTYPTDWIGYDVVFNDPSAAPVFVYRSTAVRRPLNIGTGRFQRQHAGGWLRVGSSERKLIPQVPVLNQAPRFSVTPAAQHDLPPLDTVLFYQDDRHGYLVHLRERTEFPLFRIPRAGLSPGVGRSLADMLRREAHRPGPALSRPDDLVIDFSPWRTADRLLLPGIVRKAVSRLESAEPVTPAADGFRPLMALTALPVVGEGLIALFPDDPGPGPEKLLRPIAADVLERLRPGARGSLAGSVIDALRLPLTVDTRFVTFFHPHLSTFVERLERQGPAGLFTLDTQSLTTPSFADAFLPVAGRVLEPHPGHGVDFDPGGAYSGYNWELFFHVPLLLATRLSRHQRFAEAQRWFHYVFDPTDDSPEGGSRRFWRVKPLRETGPESLEDLFARITPGEQNSPEEQRVIDQLRALAEHPFQPHRVARLRPTAYQKYVVMKYLDNLIAWGDQLFGRDTIESINEATQLYVLAARLLGKRPETVDRTARSAAQSFAELRPRLDEAGNALADLENRLPFASLIPPLPGTAPTGVSVLLGMGRALYFCIPQNDKVLGYWDVVEDRLFKIRHCMNISGVVRQLPLFEPPIDPALLVRAAAAGVEIADVVADLSAPAPRQRFRVLLRRAIEMCAEVQTFGAAMLAAQEKKDGEALAAMRARHESTVLEAMNVIKDWQIAEAEASVGALRAARDTAIHQLFHYSRLLGEQPPTVAEEPQAPDTPKARPSVGGTPLYTPTGRFELSDGGKISIAGEAIGAAAGGLVAGPLGAAVGAAIGAAAGSVDVVSLQSGAKMLTYEQDELFQSFLATTHAMAGAMAEGIAPLLNLIPQFEIAAKPVGVGAGAVLGGMALAAGASSVAKVLDAVGRWHAFKSSLAQKLAGVVWREQDHTYQRNSAVHQIAHTDREMIAAQIRKALGEAERELHTLQVEQAAEVERVLKDKYTDEELYGWMERESAGLYLRAFQLAQDLAKQAERSYRFELGILDATGPQAPPSPVAEAGSWDSLRKGLLAGDRLHLALRRLERAYEEQSTRELELTRHVSLLQLDPEALLRLRTTGSCEFDVPETLFDLDFPGHYFRRIKTVSISVPCVAGPYTGVSGTLTLLGNRLRAKATGGSAYPERTDESDPRFVRDLVPIQSVATSGGQNDAGMFELDFRDDRYLPFEGAGAVSRWRFELPGELRQFDYESISDLILHLRYTARDGGVPLREKAVESLKATFSGEGAEPGTPAALTRMISVRHEFPDAWYRFLNTPAGAERVLSLPVSKQRFPYFAARGEVRVTRLAVFSTGTSLPELRLSVKDPAADAGPEQTVTLVAGGGPDASGLTVHRHQGDLDQPVTDAEGATWEIAVTVPAETFIPPQDLVLLCDYRFTLAP
ncbi:neuraminidase-like domain-containing protein [Streptomyces exfoliatus]|uniref:Tc toxin subunit A-related protein n=1 Tax=Streptomyces exfoliatus TaxID=1905 RepID=UPI000463CEA6|nr:neuraminidase-like domain-containing protein [Streptomyces exfoliatus]